MFPRIGFLGLLAQGYGARYGSFSFFFGQETDQFEIDRKHRKFFCDYPGPKHNQAHARLEVYPA